MTEKSPLVSILLPTYNSERYIREALDSLLSQSYPNLEVVISDDASSDGTQEILREYEEQFPGIIRLYLQEKNLGVTRNCNFILTRCRGEFILFFAGDDFLYKNCISESVAAMQDGGYAMAFHNHDFVDEFSKKIRHKDKRYKGHTANLFRLIKTGVYVKCNGMMARTKHLPEQGYDESLKYSSDFDFVFRILGSDNSYIFIEQSLSAYRKHSESLTVRKRNVCLLDSSEVYLRLIKKYPKHSFFISRHVSNAFRSSRFSNANGYEYRDWLVASIGIFQFNISAWVALCVHALSFGKVKL